MLKDFKLVLLDFKSFNNCKTQYYKFYTKFQLESFF